MAGPDKPPILLPSTGFLVLISIAIAERVLIKERISAPPLWAALAILVMSLTFGESLIIIGLVKASFTLATVCSVKNSSLAIIILSSLLGQERSNSKAAIPSTLSNRSANNLNSFAPSPPILTITVLLAFWKTGNFFLIKYSTPSPGVPRALIKPEALSQIRGEGFPNRLSKKIVFVITAPKTFVSYGRWLSSYKSKVPEAGITGFFNFKLPKLTDRSTFSIILLPHQPEN